MSSTNNSMDQHINKIINDANTYIQSNVAAGTMNVENANAIIDITTKLLTVIIILTNSDIDFNAQQVSIVSTTSNVSVTSNSTANSNTDAISVDDVNPNV